LNFPLDTRAGVVAIDADAVYWVARRSRGSKLLAGVFRTPKNGRDVRELATARLGASAIALGHDTVYWLDRGEQATDGASIQAVPKEGGESRQIVAVSQACALAVDGNHLYWIEQGDPAAVKRAGLDGGSVITLAKTAGAACALVVDEGAVTWLRPGLDQVLSAPKVGGAPRVLAQVAKRPMGLSLASNGLVVVTELSPAERFESVVYRLASAGAATPRPVGRGGRAASVASDGKSVFWSAFDEGGGTIYRAPLP
jgi:hypothetical protein